ncbi:MAG: DUF4405 domain-containing protein [Bacteroidales bacterium]|nr:DUF4405 domain-containing protein [Bacteroidales bacterium]
MNKYILILTGFLCFSSATAQCPFGNGNRVDCQYGCGNFTDNNHDNYCDYSSLSATNEEKTTDTVSEPAEEAVERKTVTLRIDTVTPKTSSNTINLNTDEDTTPVTETITAEYTETPSDISQESSPAPAKRYHFLLITLLTLGLYAFTFILMQTGLLAKAYHRRIWNALLLIAGLVSCILGFLMVIHLNYPFLGAKYLTFLTWHVEAGIAMTIIMLFHIAWHWKYFKNIFKKIKTKE